MTSPEWLAADEDDADRFPQTSQESAQISTHGPDEGSRVVPDPARVARYAKAIRPVYDRHNLATYAKAVMAVADEERAALVAEVERLREELATARAESIRELQSAVRAAIRAEAAEAKVAKVEALRSALVRYHDAVGRRCNVCTGRSPQWDGHDKNPPCEYQAQADLFDAMGDLDDLDDRAVLADAPAEKVILGQPGVVTSGGSPTSMGPAGPIESDPLPAARVLGNATGANAPAEQRAEGGA